MATHTPFTLKDELAFWLGTDTVKALQNLQIYPTASEVRVRVRVRVSVSVSVRV